MSKVEKIVPTDPLFIAQLVKAAGGVGREFLFVAGPEGVYCRTKEVAGNGLYEWRVRAEYFKELPSQVVEVEVLSDFVDVFKHVKKGVALRIEVADEVVAVVIDAGSSRTRRAVPRRTFERDAQPFNSERIEAMEKSASATVLMGAGEFREALGEFRGLSESSIVVQTAADVLLLSTREDAGASVDVRLTPSCTGAVVEGSARAAYAAGLLVEMSAFLDAGFERVRLAWSRDFPIYVVGEFPGVWARAVLAPRVENGR